MDDDDDDIRAALIFQSSYANGAAYPPLDGSWQSAQVTQDTFHLIYAAIEPLSWSLKSRQSIRHELHCLCVARSCDKNMLQSKAISVSIILRHTLYSSAKYTN